MLQVATKLELVWGLRPGGISTQAVGSLTAAKDQLTLPGREAPHQPREGSCMACQRGHDEPPKEQQAGCTVTR